MNKRRSNRGRVLIAVAGMTLLLAPGSFGASSQLKPVLKAIDPAQAHIDPAAEPPAGSSGGSISQPSPNPLGGITGAPISRQRQTQPGGTPGFQPYYAPSVGSYGYSGQLPGSPTMPGTPAGSQSLPAFQPGAGYQMPAGYQGQYAAPGNGFPGQGANPGAGYRQSPSSYAPTYPGQPGAPGQATYGSPPAPAYSQSGRNPAGQWGNSSPWGSQLPYPSAAAPYPPGTVSPPQRSWSASSSPYGAGPTAYPTALPLPPYAQPPARQWTQQPAATSPYGSGQAAGAGQVPQESQIPDFAGPLPAASPSGPAIPVAGPGFGSGYALSSGAPQNQGLTACEQRVTRLEQIAFGSTYPEHEVDDRVEHLEQEVFGKSNSPDDLDTRLARLETKMGGQGAFGRPATPSSPPSSQQSPYSQPQQSQGIQPSYPPSLQQRTYSQPQQSQGIQPSYPPSLQQRTYSQPQQSQGIQPSYPSSSQLPSGYGQPVSASSLPAQTFMSSAPSPSPGDSSENGVPLPDPASTETQSSGVPVAFAPASNFQSSREGQAPESFSPDSLSSPSLSSSPVKTPEVAATASQGESPGAGSEAEGIGTVDLKTIIKNIPMDSRAGDYSNQVQRFAGTCCARWTNFPVRIHLPLGSPAPWKTAVEAAVKKWGQYIPLIAAPPSEPADIEVAWINHLQPRQLGITNLEIFNGRMRVTVYLLRPTYYLPEVSEKALYSIALHEIGHALGIFGHSAMPGDIMQAQETSQPGRGISRTRYGGITARDLNTLRKVYESPSLPEGFQSPQPIGWPCRSGP